MVLEQGPSVFAVYARVRPWHLCIRASVHPCARASVCWVWGGREVMEYTEIRMHARTHARTHASVSKYRTDPPFVCVLGGGDDVWCRELMQKNRT